MNVFVIPLHMQIPNPRDIPTSFPQAITLHSLFQEPGRVNTRSMAIAMSYLSLPSDIEQTCNLGW